MLLDVQDITKTFAGADGPIDVLSGVSLQLSAGESLALTGESGSGKSTLLSLIGALDSPDTGQILLQGQNLGALSEPDLARVRRQKVALIFQQFNLISSLSVDQNLRFHARLAGREDPDWTKELSTRLGLNDLLGRYPETLSGGQQQRVAIGRALAHRPPLVLADEPTGNLDEATGDSVLALLLELAADSGCGLIMVTHSNRLAGLLGKRLHLRSGSLA